MEPLSSAFDVTAALQSRGIDLSTLGAAYLVLIANVLATSALFAAARAHLVISPNRSARDYGVYVTVLLAALLIATVLENELAPRGSAALQYVALPNVLALMAIHVAICRSQEPRSIALGGASLAGAVLVVLGAGFSTDLVRPVHWLAVVVAAGLLAFLWLRSISTKRGFVTAKSIYIGSKESLNAAVAPQTPWLGLPQWGALIGASVLTAALNALLRGRTIADIPPAEVALESSLLVVATVAVCAIPATIYWLTRKAWMPELTRFAWLVWLVVSFAFTYGNYLHTLDRV
jgi:hypothetical protein